MLLVGSILLFSVGLLSAEESAPGLTNDQTRAIIELLKDKGIITEEEAASFMDRVSGQQAAETAPEAKQPPTPVAAEMEPEAATTDEVQALRKETQRTTEAMMVDQRLLERRVDDMQASTLDPLVDKAVKSEWTERVTLGGDLRLRYQGDYFADGNATGLGDPNTVVGGTAEALNTTEDRHRFRYRARLGLKVKLPDYREANIGKFEAGFRMTTGNEEVPVSTNDTLGDYLTNDGFVFDRAYLKYKYSPIDPLWNRMPELSLVGGRFANPWFSTDLVWDRDLNFEGLAASYETDTEQMQPFNLFLTAGIFPLQEEEFSSRDKWLWGGQIGFEYRPSYDMVLTLGAGYYDYENIDGVPNEANSELGEDYWDFTSPPFLQYGNTLMDISAPGNNTVVALASDYDILDLYFRSDMGFFYPIQIILEGQYVKNLNFSSDCVEMISGGNFEEDTEGYMLGATIGYPRIENYAEWNVGLKYKYLGADAVVDAFTDSDFHLGGTNAKGWILKGELGIYRNVWLTTRWISTNEIKGPQIGVDKLFVDLNARF
jgi:polyhydroxyalkanoate synthesis regulator phasin